MLPMLAGDIFRPSSIRARLLVFKVIYYISSLFTMKTSYLAWRQHRRNLQAG